MSKTGDSRDFNRRHEHVSALQDVLLKDGSSSGSHGLPPADETWPTAMIVCPVTVLGNWQRELEKWGYFEVGLYAGTAEQKREVLKNFKMGRLDISMVSPFITWLRKSLKPRSWIVLTGFDATRNDIDILNTLPLSLLIVDECHKLKNSKSSTTEAFNTFLCPARFGLTGTALQNSYKELWGLLDWANPGAVGTEKMWERGVVRTLVRGQSLKCTAEELANARVG